MSFFLHPQPRDVRSRLHVAPAWDVQQQVVAAARAVLQAKLDCRARHHHPHGPAAAVYHGGDDCVRNCKDAAYTFLFDSERNIRSYLFG